MMYTCYYLSPIYTVLTDFHWDCYEHYITNLGFIVLRNNVQCTAL